MPKLKLNKKQAKLWVLVRFLIRVTVLSIPLYVILWTNSSLAFLQYNVRDYVVDTSKLFGINPEVDGFDLNLDTLNGPATISIVEDCTGWKSVIAYLALILAVPTVSGRRRCIGLLGVPIIYAANIMRIVFLLWVATNMGFSNFKLFHEYLWKFGLSLIVFGTWYLWLAKIVVKIKAEKFITY